MNQTGERPDDQERAYDAGIDFVHLIGLLILRWKIVAIVFLGTMSVGIAYEVISDSPTPVPVVQVPVATATATATATDTPEDLEEVDPELTDAEPTPIPEIIGTPFPDNYRAEAIYVVVPLDSSSGDGASETVQLAQSLIHTYAFIFKTPGVISTLIETFDLDLEVRELQAILGVVVPPSGQVISVSVTLPDEADAIGLVNSLADVVNEVDGYGLIGPSSGVEDINVVLVDPARSTSTTLLPAPTAIPVPPTAIPVPTATPEPTAIPTSTPVPTATPVPVPAVIQEPADPLFSIQRLSLFSFMGLMFGVVAGYGIEWMGGKANWPSQVVNSTGLRLIGFMRRRSDEALDIEPFRIAKAYLEAAVPQGNGGRALVVTSPHSGEGKSTVVEGLARAISENGTSVVMVSSDLRGDPTIESVATLPNDQPGLCDYFLDESASLDDYLSDTSIDGVSLLARGSSPIDVIRRIDSTRMADLVRELRNRFDWVLLDSSGALETADVARLAPQTDGVLLVVDAHLSTISATQATTTLIRGSGALVVGFFHNRVRTNPVDLIIRRSGV